MSIEIENWAKKYEELINNDETIVIFRIFGSN